MGNTTNRNYPYPAGNVRPDGPAAFQALAEAVDLDVVAARARIATLEDAQAANNTAPQRRILRSTSLTVAGNSTAAVTWVAAEGDPGNPASGQPGMTLGSDGRITLSTAGLYQVSFFTEGLGGRQSRWDVVMQTSGGTSVIATTGTGGATSDTTTASMNALVPMVAGRYFVLNQASSTANSTGTGGLRMNIVRLGA